MPTFIVEVYMVKILKFALITTNSDRHMQIPKFFNDQTREYPWMDDALQISQVEKKENCSYST